MASQSSLIEIVALDGEKLKEAGHLTQASTKISKLLSDVGELPWDPAQVESHLRTKSSSAFLAKDNIHNCIGVLLVRELGAKEYEILNIAVSKNARRQGVATALMRYWIDRLPESKTIFLDVRASNTEALALYGKFAFEQVATRGGYYCSSTAQSQKVTEDGIVMRFRT